MNYGLQTTIEYASAIAASCNAWNGCDEGAASGAPHPPTADLLYRRRQSHGATSRTFTTAAPARRLETMDRSCPRPGPCPGEASTLALSKLPASLQHLTALSKPPASLQQLVEHLDEDVPRGHDPYDARDLVRREEDALQLRGQQPACKPMQRVAGIDRDHVKPLEKLPAQHLVHVRAQHVLAPSDELVHRQVQDLMVALDDGQLQVRGGDDVARDKAAEGAGELLQRRGADRRSHAVHSAERVHERRIVLHRSLENRSTPVEGAR
mmetsp:Transcript_71522/g.207068  ORF Transcript_71522/g.207068 Transcript_71522/m.207068 type:complete len:266 (+) Transcript_71522:88-885(+)